MSDAAAPNPFGVGLPLDTEVTGVNVYRSTNPTSFNFAAPTYPNQTGGTLVDSGLTNGTIYYYVVDVADGQIVKVRQSLDTQYAQHTIYD